jgi:hypothetical protein
MFVRFVVCEPGVRPARGIFRADAIDYRGLQPEWLCTQLQEHLDWFNAQLRVPRVLSRERWRGRHGAQALSWFRPEAREHISRAREFARLIGEMDSLTAEIKTLYPGQILYRDDFQIVAKPGDRTPIGV